MQCVAEDKDERPTMDLVVEMLLSHEDSCCSVNNLEILSLQETLLFSTVKPLKQVLKTDEKCIFDDSGDC